MSVDGIIAEISKVLVNLVEITGGEPLLQAEVSALCAELLNRGYRVMIETNGTQDISVISPKVRRVVDIKCPGSGCGDTFFADNLNYITPNDEIKFVLASIEDAVWAKDFCESRGLAKKCPVTFSPVQALLPYDVLADWMTKNSLNDIRFGVQLHKIIWGSRRGV